MWRRALGIAAVIEAVLIAPAWLLPWGHAGPVTSVGWLSLMVNLPGFFVSSVLITAETDFTDTAVMLLTFVLQTALIGGLIYLWQRRRAAPTRAE
jgi:hypothetical protein